jgi:predicted DCC family thiol-disulfide oxidoreductase YuxK
LSRENLAIALILGVPLLVGAAIGVVAGANLPYRIAQHAPRPLPAVWERMGETPGTKGPEWTVSRNTQQTVYPPPTEELTRVLAYEFFVHYRQEGMMGLTSRLKNCYGVYQGLEPTQPLEFRDISDPAAPLPADLPAGLTRSGLLARFHVQHGDGRIESGAHAFIALWERLPYWRWLARLGRLPGVASLMELAYRGFLRVRPTLQRWAVRRG